jgi:hypothetical protein
MASKLGSLKAIIDSGRKAGIEAYHGSPYDFPAERELQFDDPRDVPIFDQDISIFDGRAYQPIDAPVPEGARVIQEFPLGRFDSSKIGTGEGAQAYGRGSYLAESEDVARGYRDQLKGNVVIRDDGVKLPYAKHVSEIETAIKNKFPKLAPDNVRMTAKSVVNDNLVPADVEGMGVFDSTGYKAEDIYLEGIRANKGARASKGSMYKVNIDADPDELIDWDELIDEQPKKVMDKLQSADWWPYAEEGIYDIAGARGENPTGADLVRWLEQDGQEYAAEALEDLGVKGIKYADAFTRHKPKDKRSNNYVIFDPRIIEISKKYGISIPLASAVALGTMTPEEAQAASVGAVKKSIDEVLSQGQDADRGLGSLPGASGRTFKKQADETIARVYDNLRTQKDQYDEPVFDELPVGKLGGKTGRSGVTGVTRYRMPEGYAGSLEKLGRAAPDLIEIAPDADGAKYFSDQITSAKKANKFGASVYVYPQKEYKDMRLFITDDGSAGYALKPNGDVVSAFSSGTHKGIAQNILLHAVEQGGVKLDAFDTVLPDLYSTMGFRESGRIPWLDEEAPEDWNKAVFRAFNAGEPDVSFMAYSRDPAIPVEPRYESSYESAVEAQDRDVEDFRRSPLSNIIDSGGKAGLTALGASALLAPEESEASGLGSIFRGQRISTRVPTAKGATENPLTDNLVINRQALEAAPKAFDINARYVSGYPTVRTGAKTSAGRVDAFTAEAVDNLIWLYNQAPPAVRNIGKNWYVGANRISAELADKYGISRESASAVLAALSPQKDWYQNVSLAERVISGYKKSSGKVLDADSLATAKTIYSKPQFADNIKVIADTPFDDLNDVQKAMYLRSLDQTHNNRGYQMINPNGDRVGQAFSQKTGEPNTAAWGSNAEIAKAVRVIEDPSIENISQQMGGAHKVRNFFNNISDPKYSIDNPEIGDVTIDTHAVAADQIMPLSGNSAPVGAAFGTAKGVASSAQTGARGTYGLHADAYRIAANELGIQPRELQSVTWETVRSLFPKEFKTKGNVSEILEIWKLYDRGKLSKGLARELILDKAGGIPNPDWADGLDTAASGPRGLGANTGELSFSGTPGGQNTRRSDAGRNILAAGLPVGIISALGIGVSEDAEAGGLGSLPAATKKARAESVKQAKEQGYDLKNVMYHASKQDIKEFVPGYSDGLVFLTPNKEFANDWLGKGKFQERQGGTGSIEGVRAESERLRKEVNDTLKSMPEDQRQQYFEEVYWPQRRKLMMEEEVADSAIYPVVTRTKKPFVPSKDVDVLEDLYGKEYLDAPFGSGFPTYRDAYKDGNYLLYENKQVVDFLKSKGYDSMFLKENSGENNPFTTLAVFEPNNIRSVNAKFDPEKKDSPQILASAPFAAGAAGLGAAAVLSSEDAEAGGMGVRSRRMPDDVAFKAAPKKESPGLPSLVGQLGLGAMSEIAGTILGGAAGVDEYLRGSPTESIRDAREGTSEFVGGLYDAGPEAQQLGQEAVKGIAGIVGPTIDYAMEGPVMDERGLNVLPLIAKALNMSYEGWKEIYDLLPEREQEAVISAADAFL